MKFSKELSFCIIVLLVLLPQYPTLPHFSNRESNLQSHVKTPYKIASQDSVRPSEGIVGWWPGDGNAKDLIGGNNGVLFYDAGFSSGLIGSAFSFDGADDYVQITSTGLNYLQSLTIEAWVFHNTLSNKIERYITLAGDKAVLCHAGDETLQFYIRDSDSLQLIEISAYGVLQKGVFHHVAATFNGKWMRLYLDGEEVARSRFIAELYSGIGPGYFSSIGEECLDGLLDEISIYNRALSMTEIQEIYEAGSNGKCKPPDPDTSFHNLEVTLDTPMIAYVDNSISINTSVFNDGAYVENNVILMISINDSVIEAHIFPSLSSGNTMTYSYSWTPAGIGTSNITVFTTPVADETYLCDNFDTNFVVTSDGVHSVKLDPIIITSNEDFQTQGWPGDGSVGNPYIISRIEVSDTFECISITNTDVHFIIEDCYLESDRSFESYAVSIVFAENGVVEHNILYYAGVWCEFTEQVRIAYNEIRYPHRGIDHVSSIQSVISHNVIYRANSEGILSLSSDDCVITGNEITRCTIGIYILDDYTCRFTYNYIRTNWDYGIIVEDSDQNRIFGNYLDNYNNAMDDGINNEWDNGENIGNYWSNTDTSGPVQIGENPGSVDHYPLSIDSSDHSIPLIGYSPTLFIESPNDATFAWVVWSDTGTYDLFQNNSLIEEGDWLGSGSFKLQPLDLPDGLYNFTLIINDTTNGIAASSKYILVPDYILVTPPDPPQNLIISINADSIELEWEAPDHDGNLPVTGYNVYRGSRPGDYNLLAELGVVLNYIDNSIVPGTIAIYVVHAVNGIGEGLSSNAVSNLETHDPIIIGSKEDLETQGWPGNGTEGDPFVISGLNISSGSTSINMSNVNAFVVIEGCLLTHVEESDWNWPYIGIYLENVANVSIETSYVSGKSYCIFFNQSTDCTVNETYIETGDQCIRIENSDGINVADSTLKNEYGGYGYGIHIIGSNNSNISNCTLFDISFGIWLENSRLCQVWACNFSSVYYGIVLFYSSNCSVSECVMTNLNGAGIRLDESVTCVFSNITLSGKGVSVYASNIIEWNHVFDNVTIDSKPLGYFFDTAESIINASLYSQLIIAFSRELIVDGHHNANITYGMHVAYSDNLLISDTYLDYITLEFTNNSKLCNITSFGERGDVFVSYCEGLLFENFTFKGEFGWGRFYISDCNRITITASIIQTRWGAILLYRSNDCILANLIIDFEWTGILIDFSRNCTIRNVILSSTWFASGITLSYSSESHLEDITMILCGVEIVGYDLAHWIHTMNNVTVNSKQLGYFYEAEYLTIEGNDYGQLFIVDSHDIVVQNASFSNITLGLQFAYSDNCRVSDVELSNLYGYAPNLFSCESIIIENLSFHDNSNRFIIQASTDILINHCKFNDSNGGIDISVGSWNCTITENVFDNTGYAIRISDSIGCSISRNSIKNGWRGLTLYGLELSFITDNQIIDCDEGIRLEYSTNNYVTRNTVRRVYQGLSIRGGQQNQITNNRIFDCSSIGIFVDSEESSRFTYNVIANTDYRGIDLNYASSNVFYGNLLHNNGELGAHDDGDSNHWDDGIEIGNCWGLAQEDGHHQIEGEAGSVDHYPIYVESIDINAPVISSPPDIILTGTENETHIPWIVWSTPGAFEIYIDDVLSETYAWSESGPLFLELVNIGFGNHTFALVIHDAYGVNSSDTVFVVVPITLSFVVQIAAACAGGIVIIGLVVVDLRKKRKIKILDSSSFDTME